MLEPLDSSPIITGKDAKNLLRKLEENKYKKVDKAYLQELEENAKQWEAVFKRDENEDC